MTHQKKKSPTPTTAYTYTIGVHVKGVVMPSVKDGKNGKNGKSDGRSSSFMGKMDGGKHNGGKIQRISGRIRPNRPSAGKKPK